MAKEEIPHVWLLDYGAGNVRSVRNAIQKAGFQVRDVTSPEDIEKADKLIFPGVGSFGATMAFLEEKGYAEPLKRYLQADKPFLGICLGLQTLFEDSEESPGVKGLGVIKGSVKRFPAGGLAIPHIGWNGLRLHKGSTIFDPLLEQGKGELRVYFVHSYCVLPSDENRDWILATTNYGQEFVSAVKKGNVMATQFHPEKSGHLGISIIQSFLSSSTEDKPTANPAAILPQACLSKRVIACLDVRTNDAGDLVVTKGDQYDVRETSHEGAGQVRNMGKPVELARRYYEDGADEIVFLNITSFREEILGDTPMLRVLEATSENVFVPLTVGGGIRAYTDKEGNNWSALEVASQYFRAGADKVSLGSDAVYAAEHLLQSGSPDGSSSIEQISQRYGRQAVVVSIDPKRVYISSPDEVEGRHTVFHTDSPNSEGKKYYWYQCTVKGGREGRDIDAIDLAKAVEELGAGELLVNCVDMDGQNAGYDLSLLAAVKAAVSIPVIASSGAGCPQHFVDVFRETHCDAALAAGIFHRQEVKIQEVKEHLQQSGLPVRL